MKRILFYVVFGLVVLVVGVGLGSAVGGSSGSRVSTSTVTSMLTSTLMETVTSYTTFTQTASRINETVSTVTSYATSYATSTVTDTVVVTSTSVSPTTVTSVLRSTETVTDTDTVTSTTTSVTTVTDIVTVTSTVRVEPNYTVEFLGDEAYYERVSSLLDKAGKYVYVAMYLMKYDVNEEDDPVNMLLEKLVELHNRGVDVRVVVDDYTKSHYNDTISYLRENGIPVKLDPYKSTRLHAKIIIIDGKWLVVGSHNWSESGLQYNEEAAILTNKTQTIIEAQKYYDNLWNNGRTP